MTAAHGLIRPPHFIVIGAIKAATTWTAHKLNENPALSLPGPEPHFFSVEWERGFTYYDSLFADAPRDAIVGEKSADYLSHERAAERIAATVPDAKLIVQLRNPVERAYSDYRMLYRRGTVREAPDAYFAGSDAYGARFLEGGLYATHLKRFLDRFPREQLLVVPYEDVSARPEATLRAISAHIGVEPHVPQENLTKPANDGAAAVLPLPMRTALRPFKDAVRGLRGNPAFEAVRGVFARPVRYPPLTQSARERLTDFYREDVEALGRLLGRDLSGWLSPDGGAPADAPTNSTGERTAIA
ncbi:MAG: sulfotransferase [Parvularculaceae bacterium]